MRKCRTTGGNAPRLGGPCGSVNKAAGLWCHQEPASRPAVLPSIARPQGTCGTVRTMVSWEAAKNCITSTQVLLCSMSVGSAGAEQGCHAVMCPLRMLEKKEARPQNLDIGHIAASPWQGVVSTREIWGGVLLRQTGLAQDTSGRLSTASVALQIYGRAWTAVGMPKRRKHSTACSVTARRMQSRHRSDERSQAAEAESRQMPWSPGQEIARLS